MGILDDAIREHLELKRAHGASEDEVTRKEAEAFGPARAEAAADETTVMAPEFAERPEPDEPPEFAEASTAEAPDVQAVPEAYAPPEPEVLEPELPPDTGGFAAPLAESPPAPVDQPTEAFDPFADEDPHAPPPPVFPAGERSAPVEEPPVEEPPVEVPPPGEEPVPAEEPVAEEPPPPPVEEPPGAGFDSAFADEPEPEPPVEGDVEGEDVLEETPEFLQDTPEHDRLWFEQKPPRDFDFGN